jgi:hypothetical protein
MPGCFRSVSLDGVYPVLKLAIMLRWKHLISRPGETLLVNLEDIIAIRPKI